jgi:outer membrane protein assembly factor BamB
MRRLAGLAPLLMAAAVLYGCADAKSFLGMGSYKIPMPGSRVSVLQLNQSLAADPALANVKVLLPQPFANPDWPQAGGYPSHAMHHLAMGKNLNVAWTVSVGTGDSDNHKLLSEPIVADGRIYAMDARSRVSAFDAATGGQIWRIDVAKDVDSGKLLGGGLAYDNGKIFVATSFAQLIALDAKTGKELWHTGLSAPMRAAPAASDGRVFVITIDNNLYALAQDDGRQLWSHSGITQSAGLLGGTTPAVLGIEVIAAYSSGEMFALRADSGRTLWSENLAGKARSGAIATLADIRGRPIIDRNLVIAISHSGTMAAIDGKRGGRSWDANFGGSQSPWVAGDYIFVLTNEQELLCLVRADGHVRWISAMPKYADPPDNTQAILWQGPVLAGDRLILTGTDGKALAVSPYTGKLLGQIDLPSETHLPPIVARETVYILSDNGDLTALR